MKQNNNGTTAAQVNNERTQQYDEVTKVIRISFEHDGRMSAEDAREYVAARAIGYADHTGTIDEGTRIMDVEDMGEPEPERRPTFAEAARDEVESHYNNGDSNDETAQAIAKAISRAVADIYGKGNAARYILDTISYHVQSHCNTVLNDEDDE